MFHVPKQFSCFQTLAKYPQNKHPAVLSLISTLSSCNLLFFFFLPLFLWSQSGFGNIDGEYWLGLEGIYNLGRQGDYKLVVELEDWMGKKVYAQYSSFHLEPESEAYRLRLGTYMGNAGDSLSSHNGKQFTTLDRDKDAFSGRCVDCVGGACVGLCGL